MKIRYKLKIISAITLSITIIGCSTKINKYPDGNMNNIDAAFNTHADEVAPAQRSIELNICGAFDREHSNTDFRNESMKPSSQYIREMFPVSNFNREIVDYLTKNIESLVFITSTSGFAAFSHPITDNTAHMLKLPFAKGSANVGGTDIFEFYRLENGQFEFKNLGEPINSIFWDSHPTAIRDTLPDGSCVTLLIWSSDRNSPYSERIDLRGNRIHTGNMDLFYAFRFEDGSWSEVKSFDDSINMFTNEGTPFLYCSCCNPTLLFTSDRQKVDDGDFDIYYVSLSIDYSKFEINRSGDVRLLSEKNNDKRKHINSINSLSDERFPFIPLPHGTSSPELIYFASSRYDANNKKQFRAGDTIFANKGSYDIYRLPIPDFLNCPAPEPPTVELHVTLLNIANPSDKVREPILALVDASGNEIVSVSDNLLKTEILLGKQYFIKGGSNYNSIDCDENPVRVLHKYVQPQDTIINVGVEQFIEKKILRDLTTTFSEYERLPKLSYDTTFSEKTVFGKILKVTTIATTTIINPRITDNSMAYDKEIYSVSTWDKLKKISVYRPLNKLSDAIGASTLSEMSKNGGWNVPRRFAGGLIIYDTVYVQPEYFIKPPCYCEFTEFMTSYEQNVPYFQTGFWEVNTLSNFRRDLNCLGRREFAEAKWIELHRNNQYFGQSENRRQGRIYEYEKFARIVDKNLDIMAEIINKRIIPAFNIIDSISGNEKLIISLDAWSDRRPVRRGWYIGEPVTYYEGSLVERDNSFEISFNKVYIKDGNMLNMNNDTLSRLRAFYGYNELIKRLLDTNKFGDAFYNYFKSGKVLLPDNRISISGNVAIDGFNPAQNTSDAKIILLIKGNYFDPTEYKIPQYIRNVDSSLYMLDTIRRIDLRVKNLYYSAGRLIESPCCNKLLPCLDYNTILNSYEILSKNVSASPVTSDKSLKYVIYFGTYEELNTVQQVKALLEDSSPLKLVIEEIFSEDIKRYVLRSSESYTTKQAEEVINSIITLNMVSVDNFPEFLIDMFQVE